MPLEDPADILSHVMRLFRISGDSLAEQSTRMGARFALNPNFVSNLRNSGAIPSLHHLYALSEILHLTIGSVFRLFGLDIDGLLAFESQLNKDRTRLVESWPLGKDSQVLVPATLSPAILSEKTSFLYELVPSWQKATLQALSDYAWREDAVFYGKLSSRDRNASPDIPPGAYIQMLPFNHSELIQLSPENFYFVQHPWGYTVCHCIFEGGWLYLRSQDPSFGGPHRLRYGRFVRILGRVTAYASSLPVEHEDYSSPVLDPNKTVLATAPGEAGSVQRLFSLERMRHDLTRHEIDEAGAKLSDTLGVKITGKYARELEVSEHLPRTVTALGLAMIYSVRIQDLFRSCGIVVNDQGKYSLEHLLALSANYLPPVLRPSASMPSPESLWIEFRKTWREWPMLLSKLHPNLEQHAHAILRLNQSHHYQGLDRLLHPGSLLLLETDGRYNSATFSAHNDGRHVDWERRLYVIRRDTSEYSRLYCGYLETSSRSILLRAHPQSESIPVIAFPRSEVSILGSVRGIASTFQARKS